MTSLISKFSLFFLFICASQIFAQDDMEKLKATIQEGNDKYAKAIVDGTSESLVSGYTEDAILMPNYSPMQKGIEAIKNAMNMDAQSGNKFTEFTLTASDVYQYRNLVYEVGKYTYTLEIKGMNKTYKDEGKFLTVFEKQDDGSLKIKADIWNTDINPWSSMEKKSEKD